MYFVKDILGHGKYIYKKVDTKEFQIAIMRWTDGCNPKIVKNIAKDAKRIVDCLNYCEHIETEQLNYSTQNNSSDFKRCPFCKSNDVGIYAVPKRYEIGKYKHTVGCNKCGGSTGEYYNAEEAMQTWNKTTR